MLDRVTGLKALGAKLRSESPRAALGDLGQATGKGIGIAVIDSGISPHPDLDDKLVEAISTVPNSPSPNDVIGHGTHVASLALGSGKASNGKIMGVAPDARLISVRVSGTEELENRADSYGTVLTALRWCIDNKERYNIRVINMSVGYGLTTHQGAHTLPYPIDLLATTVQEAVSKGLVIVAAAGNDGPGPGTVDRTPAVHPDVITVGALDTNSTPADPSDDFVAPFSSRGPGPFKGRPDVLASGYNILGSNVPQSHHDRRNEEAREHAAKILACSDADLPALARPILQRAQDSLEHLKKSPPELRDYLLKRLDPKPVSHFLDSGHPAYIASHGTSMSAPIVAGLVACMLEVNPSLTPPEVREILMDTANPLNGVDFEAQGAGVVDGSAALAAAARRASNA